MSIPGNGLGTCASQESAMTPVVEQGLVVSAANLTDGTVAQTTLVANRNGPRVTQDHLRLAKPAARAVVVL